MINGLGLQWDYVDCLYNTSVLENYSIILSNSIIDTINKSTNLENISKMDVIEEQEKLNGLKKIWWRQKKGNPSESMFLYHYGKN